MHKIKYIAFDADDTLWVNEPHFQKIEKEYVELISEFADERSQINNALFKTEMNNISLFGYGVKSFTLSMIENAITFSNYKVSTETIEKIILLGKKLLSIDVELLPDVEMVLRHLSEKYCLIVATKGDLLDQETKLKKSGLAKYFDHIEIMSDKKVDDYKALLHRLNIEPNSLVMVGNSLKSDILPVIELGARAIYVPYKTTWQFEKVDEQKVDSSKYIQVNNLSEVLEIIK